MSDVLIPDPMSARGLARLGVPAHLRGIAFWGCLAIAGLLVGLWWVVVAGLVLLGLRVGLLVWVLRAAARNSTAPPFSRFRPTFRATTTGAPSELNSVRGSAIIHSGVALIAFVLVVVSVAIGIPTGFFGLTFLVFEAVSIAILLRAAREIQAEPTEANIAHNHNN